MSKTCIGTMGLIPGSSGGSVELPQQVTLYCPQCGTEAADKGQCIVSFMKIPNNNQASATYFEVVLMVDCRTCGCSDRAPGMDLKDSHHF